jgi:hypothetical protein
MMLLLAFAASAFAQEVEFRRFVLQDGRTFDTQVVATEDSGFRVRIPQGEWLIPYELFADMQNIDAATYAAQAPWNVWLAAPEREGDSVRRALGAIPGTRVMNSDPGPQRGRAAACGTDIPCIQRALADSPIAPWVVTLRPLEGAWHIEASRGDAAPSRFDVTPSPNAVLTSLYTAFGVTPVGTVPDLGPALSPPPVAAAPVPPPAPAEEAAAPWGLGPESAASPTASAPLPSRPRSARAWVPVPGYGALRDGDYAGFALGMATVVPTTALWTGAVGSNAQSPGQHLAMTLAGYYVATVVVNQIFETRSAPVAVGIAPAPQGAHAVVAFRR